jgi:hypothetical protein
MDVPTNYFTSAGKYNFLVVVVQLDSSSIFYSPVRVMTQGALAEHINI